MTQTCPDLTPDASQFTPDSFSKFCDAVIKNKNEKPVRKAHRIAFYVGQVIRNTDLPNEEKLANCITAFVKVGKLGGNPSTYRQYVMTAISENFDIQISFTESWIFMYAIAEVENKKGLKKEPENSKNWTHVNHLAEMYVRSHSQIGVFSELINGGLAPLTSKASYERLRAGVVQHTLK